MKYLLLIALSVLGSGCSQSYITPGGPADLAALGVTPEMRAARAAGTDSAALLAAFDRKPLATFPVNLAVVRVQGADYRSHSARGSGGGRYTVVSLRDLEAPDHTANPIERITDWPMIRSVAPLNRMVVGGDINSDQDLRLAAAQLQADVLLIYTLDTMFFAQQQAAPLSVVTLGLSPTKSVRVTCTASAVLMDTRNGYIYGLAEATADNSQLANAWTSCSAIDQTRRRVERKAFEQLFGECETVWSGVVARHAPE